MKQFNCIAKLPNSNNGQPVWIDSLHALFWVDGAKNRLYNYDAIKKEIHFSDLDQPIISLSPRLNNGFIATLEDGIGFYEMQTRKVTYISKPEPFSNDYKTIAGVNDNFGNYWTFTQPQDTDKTQKGHLYQLSSSMNMSRIGHDEWLCTAPPIFSKDGKKLFQSCGNNRYIYVTSMNEQGQPITTEPFLRISKSEGYPHGLCIDNEDNLWVCHRGIGLISKFNSDGERTEKISIAAPGIKYCTFGGDNLDTLFIVTSNLDEPSQEKKKIQFTDAILTFKPGNVGLNTNCFYG